MEMTDARNGIIAGFVMVAIAVAIVLYVRLTRIHRRKVASSYPSALAEVVKIRAVKNKSEGSFEERGVGSYKVTLRYTVDGKEYRCMKKCRERAESPIKVYYRPDDPGKAYTEEWAGGRYVSSNYIMAGIIGGLGLTVIVYVLTQMA